MTKPDNAKISVVINTYNAEHRLREVLESVKDFDEVLICDMESTDTTLQIAQEYGCRIVTFPKGNHTIVEPARQFAIDHAAHEWVLVVDADEVVTPQLRDYLYRHASQRPEVKGVWIPRKNYFMGRLMHCRYPDKVLRFFKKDACTWPNIIHCSPTIAGSTTQIPARRMELALEHLADDGVRDILRKNNVYSDNEIGKRQGQFFGPLAILYRPTARFLRGYLLKGGFRDGLPGFIYAVLEAEYQFAIMAKLHEAKHRKKAQ